MVDQRGHQANSEKVPVAKLRIALLTCLAFSTSTLILTHLHPKSYALSISLNLKLPLHRNLLSVDLGAFSLPSPQDGLHKHLVRQPRSLSVPICKSGISLTNMSFSRLVNLGVGAIMVLGGISQFFHGSISMYDANVMELYVD